MSGARPVVLAGCTASGKSALALALAAELAGELICADSRQVYEGFVIGAAGPTLEERAAASHHLYGAVAPEEPYDAGRFVDDADAAVRDIAGRGGRPILVGGTGLYLRAFRYGLGDVPQADPEARARVLAALDERGLDALYADLLARDPETAGRVARTDAVRITRALEVLEATGQPASALRTSHLVAAPRVEATWLLLDAPPDWLGPRLARRVDAMFDAGLVDEAVGLRERLGPGHRLLGTLGYAEALLVADGVLEEAAARERTTVRQRQYAKRQRTWFKKEPWWIRLDPRSPDLLEEARRALGDT